jgi:hypothetical protein
MWLTGCAGIVTPASPSKGTPPQAPSPIAVSVSPSSVTLQTGQAQQFSAQVQNDPQNAGVTWALSQAGNACSPACGTLSSTGGNQTGYSAPAAVPIPPSVLLTATSMTDSTKSASVSITVIAPPSLGVTISISPSSASVQVGQGQEFIATVQNDTQGLGVSWGQSQAGTQCFPTCGRIYSDGFNRGLYTAPNSIPVSPAVTLTAYFNGDFTKSASVQVTIIGPPAPTQALTLIPGYDSLKVGQMDTFYAVLQNDPQGLGVTWALNQSGNPCSPSCGTLTGTTIYRSVYTAPQSLPFPSTVSLTATSITDGAKSAVATIQVVPAISGGLVPNQWINITDYGGRNFESPVQSGTCSISAGSVTLRCQSPLDWINGDGIRVDKAGALTSLSTPTGITVQPIGVLSGSTRYDYQVVAESYYGALTPASAAGATFVGASTLGVNSVNLIGCALAQNGTTTYTTTVPHNFQVGATVSVSNTTKRGVCDGTLTIASVPTPTTFTSANFDKAHTPDNATGGTAQVLAGNVLTWSTFPVLMQSSTLRYWIYRNGALIGVAQGNDSYYVDNGYGQFSGPSYVPLAPPATGTPGWLSTTIVSGAGTNNLTLAKAATTTATNQPALHDNSPALFTAVSVAAAESGGNVVIPSMGDALTTYPFTTSLIFPPGAEVRILVAGGVTLDQPWILRSGMTIEGQSGSGNFHAAPFFGGGNYGYIGGSAYPLMYSMCNTSTNFQSLLLVLYENQQWGLLMDSNSTCANTLMTYQDFFVITNGFGSVGEVIRGGGFSHSFLRGGFDAGSGGAFASEQLQILSSQNQGPFGGLTAVVSLDGTFFSEKGIRVDNSPGCACAGGADMYTVENMIFENVAGPLLKVNLNGNAFSNDWTIKNINLADSTVGPLTPLIDLGNSTNLQAITITDVSLGNGYTPVFAGATNPSIDAILTNIGVLNP